jgi:hypothetical protein
MKKIVAMVAIGFVLMAVGGVASAHGTKSITNHNLTIEPGIANGSGTFTTGSAGHQDILVSITMFRDGNQVLAASKHCTSSLGTCTKVGIKRFITCTQGHTAKVVIAGTVVVPSEPPTIFWTSATKSCVN